MGALSRGLAFRLAAVSVGVVGGVVWILVADGGSDGVRGMSGSVPSVDSGRTLTAAERAANADCVSVARWKRHHDGYPPPYLLVKPVGGGPIERIPFDEGWRAAKAGEVWTHGACPVG
jgi:hypothetical protein